MDDVRREVHDVSKIHATRSRRPDLKEPRGSDDVQFGGAVLDGFHRLDDAGRRRAGPERE